MFFKIYKTSALATFVSIIAAVCVWGGVAAVFNGIVLGGIVIGVIGMFIHIWADEIGEKAAFEKWTKELKLRGYTNKVAEGNFEVALALYKQNPTERTIQYFASLNPQVGARLREIAKAAQAQKEGKKKG